MKRHYNFYATLLDKYQNYLMSGITYQKFWGSSESPQKTEEEFEVQEFQSLIDSINRVPFESELADKGTAFNEVIDCIIEHRKSDRMGIKSDKSTDIISVHFKKWNFTFSKKLCIEFAFSSVLINHSIIFCLFCSPGLIRFESHTRVYDEKYIW